MMEIKAIPIELVIALVSGLYTFMYLIWSKLDKIWKEIGHIEKDYVENSVCDKRRKECPCAKDIQRIEEEFHESRKNRKI